MRTFLYSKRRSDQPKAGSPERDKYSLVLVDSRSCLLEVKTQGLPVFSSEKLVRFPGNLAGCGLLHFVSVLPPSIKVEGQTTDYKLQCLYTTTESIKTGSVIACTLLVSRIIGSGLDEVAIGSGPDEVAFCDTTIRKRPPVFFPLLHAN